MSSRPLRPVLAARPRRSRTGAAWLCLAGAPVARRALRCRQTNATRRLIELRRAVRCSDLAARVAIEAGRKPLPGNHPPADSLREDTATMKDRLLALAQMLLD